MIRKYLFIRSADGPGANGGGGSVEVTEVPAPLALIGQATPEQIAAWKLKYKLGIYSFECNGQVGYFKNPDRKEINCALFKADPEYPLAHYEELATITWLPENTNTGMLTDDTIYSMLMACMKSKLNGIPGRLVNL